MEKDEVLLADPFEMYCLYVALKTHFNTKGFDYTKYGHRNVRNITLESFRNRKDLVIWYRLARRIDIGNAKEFFISQFVENSWIFSFEIATNLGLAWEVYLDYRKRMDKLQENYIRDLKWLGANVGDWKDVLQATTNYPKVFDCVLKKYIAPETYAYLTWIFDLVDRRKYKGVVAREIMFDLNQKYWKYRMLLPYSVVEMGKITPRSISTT